MQVFYLDKSLAYIGSLISSLTTPTFSKPLDTFQELLINAKDLDIMTQKSTGNFSITKKNSFEV
jgi:hypothetical protein